MQANGEWQVNSGIEFFTSGKVSSHELWVGALQILRINDTLQCVGSVAVDGNCWHWEDD